MTRQWTVKGGETVTRVDRWLYEFDVDMLRLCWPNVFGEYPDVISDRVHGVVTLIRDHGPPPKTKQASGKKQIEDAVLGSLKWDDNFDWWECELELKSGLKADFHVEPGEDEGDTAAVTRGREFLQWLRENEHSARQFAASKLLDTHNDSWNEADPTSAEEFANRMTLESVGIDPDGSASMYYHDGDLFWGHTIIVSVKGNHLFKDASIAG